jgi:hypothetical protein
MFRRRPGVFREARPQFLATLREIPARYDPKMTALRKAEHVPAALVVAIVAFCSASPALAAALAPVESGIDRSNMSTQWTLAWPQEPNVSPFLAAEYNQPGNFEARRVAVLDGIARIRAQWFRDGFGKGPPELFVDLVHLVHARRMKLLAVFGAAASDYPPGAYKLVDGYGAHLYPTSNTTVNMVEGATNALRYDAAHFPHVNEKPIWITEWNPSGSSWWNGRPWYLIPDVAAAVAGATH